MENLNKDMLFKLAMKLDFLSLIQFCKVSKRIYEKIYKNADIWNHKLEQDFSNSRSYKSNNLENYTLLHNLTNLRIKLQLTENICELFENKALFLVGLKKHLKTLPKEMSVLEDLVTLHLRGNRLKVFPKIKLSNLRILNMHHNKLKNIENIVQLYNLHTINLCDNNIKKIPKEISNLSDLQILLLSNNKLKEIENICNLKKLVHLYLNNNKITKIPKKIKQLQNLRILRLSNNKLIKIPKKIGKLSSLTELDLNNNHLTSIPKEIGNLEKLKFLSLHNNQIGKYRLKLKTSKILY